MSDLMMKELQRSLPEAVSTRLMEEANFLKSVFALDETQAGLVERALFRGAGIMREGAERC